MTSRLTTPNLLEIAYLLERQHRIVAVSTARGWSNGIEELAVSLEGENIELDRAFFFRHGKVGLSAVVTALESVRSAIWQKIEGGER